MYQVRGLARINSFSVTGLAAAFDAGMPEPGSMLLFGGGAILLALRRRK